MEHSDLIDAFLKKNNLENESFEWITGDAAFRRYARIGTYPNSFILMDTPKSEKPDKFIIIDEILRQKGLSAPKIYAQDLENGFILLEDFGDNGYQKKLDNGFDEENLYLTAVDALTEVAKIKDFQGVPLYDLTLIHTGLGLFTDWFMPQALQRPTADNEKQAYFDLFDCLFDSIHHAPQGLMLADYHVDNLMFLENRVGFQACGLLDFQDGTIGPLAYDLVSLTEDVRRLMNPVLAQTILTHYLQKAQIKDKELFMRSYHITAVKRHLRVIGIFTRLTVRDGKKRYLAYIPAVWKLLESHLNQPYLQDLKIWLDKNVPAEYRGIPQSLQEFRDTK